MIGNQFILGIAEELVVDLFAGGGGASTGIEQAIGRHVDIAINHDPDAIGMHEVNHPQTEHFIEDVFAVDPLKATGGRRVGLLHASPDCTHHSQALGGQPRDQEIRSLAWVVPKWVGILNKRGKGVARVTLENVEQMLHWSPLIAKRDPKTGRVVTLDRILDPATGKKDYRVAAEGEHVPRRNQFLVPDPKRKGRNWRHFVEHLRGLGGDMQWRVIKNADLGAHSTRERLYAVIRFDGQPIVWPELTHSKNGTSPKKKWRPSADCIDWSVPGRSIFGRDRELVDATKRRLAYGLKHFVLEHADPFIVPATHVDASNRTRSVREPLATVTAANRGELMLAAPVLVPVTHMRDVAFDVRDPLRTITTAKGGETALAAAFMVQANGGFNDTHARDARDPMSTVTTSGSQQQLAIAHLTTLRRNARGRDARAPMTTITSGGEHQALVEYHLSEEDEAGALRVAAFLMRYHGTGGQWADLREPMTTITTRDRLALVTVLLKGKPPMVVTDILMRMLLPRELYNAQDFPATYVIDRTSRGKRLTKTAQVRMCGNSVSPLPMSLIVGANYRDAAMLREAA